MKLTLPHIISIAIIALTVIEIVALSHGINGQLLRFVTGTIVGLVALLVPSPLQK